MRVRRPGVLVLIVLVLVMLVPLRAHASTVLVDDDGADCPNAKYIGANAIQDAITYEPPNTVITVCPGTYYGLTNYINYQYKPVTIKGIGKPTVYMNTYGRLGDIEIDNLKIISDNIGMSLSGRVVIENTSITIHTPSLLYGGIPAQILIRQGASVIINNSIVSGGTPETWLIYSYPAASIEIYNSVINASARLYADSVILENNLKTRYGDNPTFFAGIIGGFTLILPHPSMDLRGSSIVLTRNRFEGSIFVKGDYVNITRNVFDAQGKLVYNYYRNPSRPSAAMLYANGSGVIMYNVFKNAGYLGGNSVFGFLVAGKIWGALLVGGAYTVTRNLFYDNIVGLQAIAPSLIYDNLFIDNDVQAVSNTSGAVFYINPPVNSTNIIGGPLLGGNYWSDYRGYDLNGDGLGDKPYVNKYGVVDDHPLLLPDNSGNCPPFSGGMLSAQGGVAAWILPIGAVPLMVAAEVFRRRRRGLAGQLGLIASVALSLTLTLLAVFIVYSPSTSALTKSGVVLNTVGEPRIIGVEAHIVLYNPSSYPVCIESILFDGRKATIFRVDKGVEVDIDRLVEAVLSGNISAVPPSFKMPLNIVEPKHSIQLIGFTSASGDEVNMTVITNAGVYSFYARVER